MNDLHLPVPSVFLFIILIWSAIWTGFALWRAAKDNQRNWFILFLVIHTSGILELVYLFFFAKKKWQLKDLQFWSK